MINLILPTDLVIYNSNREQFLGLFNAELEADDGILIDIESFLLADSNTLGDIVAVCKESNLAIVLILDDLHQINDVAIHIQNNNALVINYIGAVAAPIYRNMTKAEFYERLPLGVINISMAFIEDKDAQVSINANRDDDCKYIVSSMRDYKLNKFKESITI